MTNDHKKYILNLLDMLKPCDCNEFILYAADVTLTDGTYVENQWLGILNATELSNVGYTENNIEIIDYDNMHLHCAVCGANWIAWNYLLDERFRSALSHLAPVED